MKNNPHERIQTLSQIPLFLRTRSHSERKYEQRIIELKQRFTVGCIILAGLIALSVLLYNR